MTWLPKGNPFRRRAIGARHSDPCVGRLILGEDHCETRYRESEEIHRISGPVPVRDNDDLVEGRDMVDADLKFVHSASAVNPGKKLGVSWRKQPIFP